MKGGSLKVYEVKAFLNASYEPGAPIKLFDYRLDEKLSNLYGKVYVDMSKKKIIVDMKNYMEQLQKTMVQIGSIF